MIRGNLTISTHSYFIKFELEVISNRNVEQVLNATGEKIETKI